MSRTTGDLFTGIHSVRAQEVAKQRDDRRQSRTIARVELGNDAQSVLDLIKTERDALPKILWEMITPTDTKESMEAKKTAVKMYDTYLAGFHNKVATILKKPLVIEDK